MLNSRLTLLFATVAATGSFAYADCPRGRTQQGSKCIANSKPPCADEYNQLGNGAFAICVIKPSMNAGAPAQTSPSPPPPPPCPAGTVQQPNGECEAMKSEPGRGGGG